jgi:hypothetical protein
MEFGKRTWAIAEGHIPSWSKGPEQELVSHEAACILDSKDAEAHIELTIYFSAKDLVGPYKITVPPERTFHLRFNDLKVPKLIPLGTGYLSVFVSDVPIVIKHGMLDSRQMQMPY